MLFVLRCITLKSNAMNKADATKNQTMLSDILNLLIK